MTTRPITGIARLFRDLRGTSAIEFAFLMPTLTAAVLPIYDLGMGFYAKMRVQDSAQAGAQYAQLHTPFSSTAIAQAASAASSLTGVTTTAAEKCGCPDWPPTAGSITWISATPPNCSGTVCADGSNAGTYAVIDTQYSYATVINYPALPSSYALSAESVVRLQ